MKSEILRFLSTCETIPLFRMLVGCITLKSISESQEDGRNLFDVLEDRNLKGSVIIVSQIPIENWYDMISSPTIADAILDRLVHNSYKIELKGESMRRKKINSDIDSIRPVL